MDSRAGKQENAGKDRHSDEGRCDQHGPISENCNGSGLSMHQSGENDNDSLVYRVGEGTFIEEALRDVTRGLSETELGQLAEELVYEKNYRQLMREINRIQAVCLIFAHQQLLLKDKILADLPKDSQ